VAVGEMQNLDKIKKKTMGWGDSVFLPFFSPRASGKVARAKAYLRQNRNNRAHAVTACIGL
jgi:hypothetical protein